MAIRLGNPSSSVPAHHMRNIMIQKLQSMQSFQTRPFPPKSAAQHKLAITMALPVTTRASIPPTRDAPLVPVWIGSPFEPVRVDTVCPATGVASGVSMVAVMSSVSVVEASSVSVSVPHCTSLPVRVDVQCTSVGPACFPFV